ncbi:MAG: hypothetical protein V4760_19105, partial [Bdellovibrionota bacterium]
TPGPCTYTPIAGDGRKLVVKATPNGGTLQTFPAISINAVPYALQASAIEGVKAAEIVRGASGANFSPLTNAQFDALLALSLGTSSAYQQYGKLQGVTVPAMTSGHVLGWNTGAWVSVDPVAGVSAFAKAALPTCSAGDFLKDNGSGALICATPAGGGGTVTSVASGGAPISVGGTAAAPTVSIAQATTSASGYLSSTDWNTFNGKQASLGYTPVNKAGDTMTGLLLLSGDPVSAAGAATKSYVDTLFSPASGGVTVTPFTGNALVVNQNTASTSTSTGALVVGGGAGIAGSLNVGGPVTATGYVKLYGSTSGWTGFAPPTVAPNITYTLPTSVPGAGQVLSSDAAGYLSWINTSSGNALTANPLSQFAATSSAQLAGVLSDEVGTGAAVLGTSPTFSTDITTPKILGGSGTTSTLTYQTTSGAGATGAGDLRNTI